MEHKSTGASGSMADLNTFEEDNQRSSIVGTVGKMTELEYAKIKLEESALRVQEIEVILVSCMLKPASWS
jgi:hypothetical protein